MIITNNLILKSLDKRIHDLETELFMLKKLFKSSINSLKDHCKHTNLSIETNKKYCKDCGYGYI